MGSTSKYRQNFSHTTWTLEPSTRLGLRERQPSPTFSRQRQLIADPASMTASLEPTVDAPVAVAGASSRQPSAWNRSATIDTQRDSIAAVAGYSSLSIMFLSN